MKKQLMVLVIVIGCFFIFGCDQHKEKQLSEKQRAVQAQKITQEKEKQKIAQAQVDRHIAVYRTSDVKEGKISALAKLLNINTKNSIQAYYLLLDESSLEQVELFNIAMGQEGKKEAVNGAGDYVQTRINEVRKRINKPSEELNNEEKEYKSQQEKQILTLVFKIIVHAKEFKTIASKNPDYFARKLRDAYAGKNFEIPVLKIKSVPLIILKEKGFEALLRSVDEKTRTVLFFSKDDFEENIVIPSLKVCEDPRSTRVQRESAGMMIIDFPSTNKVIDKVVEAYKHGRYFDESTKTSRGKKTTLEKLFEISASWWGNLIKSNYRGDKYFTTYVAEKYLNNPDDQDRVIELISNIDFKVACPYLCKLDYASLSVKAQEALRMCLYISPIEENNGTQFIRERYKLFVSLFYQMNCRDKDRSNLLFHLSDYSSDNQIAFVTNCFGKMTKNEKETIVHMASKMDIISRNIIYKAIEKECDENLLNSIDYYKNL